MPAPMYTGDALESWKRFGGNLTAPLSFTAPVGSSASLQPAPPPSVKQAATVAPAAEESPINYGEATGINSVAEDAGIDYGDANIEEHLKSQKAALDAGKPAEVSATYQGPEAHSTYWGGSLVGGSRTGVEDYGNWQSQRGQYTQALQKWQQQYADWEKGQKMWDEMRARNTASQTPQPAVQPTAQQSPYGPASTQQQNLGQSPTTQPPSPYAVPGQRSTPMPGTGPVQKPDKSLGKVNPQYAGVL